jgi:uncharacterized protein
VSGSVIGGVKAAQTNKTRYGKDFYSRIGAEGGKNGHTGGFYANRELASIAGRKGGQISKRGPSKATIQAQDKAIEQTVNKVERSIFSFIRIPHRSK